MTPITVPIDRVKQLAEDLGADAVVVVAFRGDSFATTSSSQAFARVADIIHDDLEHGVLEIPDVPRTPDPLGVNETTPFHDIVTRLRVLGSGAVGTISGTHCPLMNDAADAIEELVGVSSASGARKRKQNTTTLTTQS